MTIRTWLRKNWKMLLGLLVSGIFVFFSVRELEPLQVWQTFKQARYVWVVPAVLLYLFALLARTARWQVLLFAERRVSIRRLLPTMAMGRAANNIYPFRTGELIRILLLRRRNGVSAATGLASILVERTFDGLTMILFLLLAALLGGIPPELRIVVWLAIIVFGAALVLIYAIVLWPDPIGGAVNWAIDRILPHRFRHSAHDIAERFITGFSAMRSVGTLTLVLLFSISVWTAETISYRLLMNAFGFHVTLHHLLLMSGAANLGTALPSGPANVGTFDYPAIGVLVSVGIAEERAASYQALLHAVLWTTETLAGLVFMWRSGLSRRELREEEERDIS